MDRSSLNAPPAHDPVLLPGAVILGAGCALLLLDDADLMATIGAVVGVLRRVPRAPIGDALVGVVLLPLLIQVRNSFAAVPAQLMLGLVLLGVVYIWSSRWP